MSYLETKISRKQFILQSGKARTQNSCAMALSIFDKFCKVEYGGKNGDEILSEVQVTIKQHGNSNMVYHICNAFILWLQDDHPEIPVERRNWKDHVHKHKPSSIRLILQYIRTYFEECGDLELSERKWRKRVKFPKMETINQERFTKQDVRDLVDVATPKRKALYMTLKDSGMRIGEAVQLRKEDIGLTTNPVRITIHRGYTKTSSDRISYVTRETKPYLEKLLAKTKDGSLVFGCSDEVEKAVACEDITFRRMRELTGLTEKYKDTNRYKKTLHGLRKYCATQLEERWDKDFGHKILGHKRYLDTYFLNDDTPEKYLKAENHLMVYQTVEFDEIDYEQMKNEIETEMETKMQKMYKLLQEKEERLKVLQSLK